MVIQTYQPGFQVDIRWRFISDGDFIYWERHLQKNSLQSHWEVAYQVLLTDSCATKLQGIDSWIHVTYLKELPNT